MNTSSTNAPDESENAGDDALAMLLNDATSEPAAKPAKAEAAATPAPKLDVPPAIDRLAAATAGLLMPSESDEPFRTVYRPLEKSEFTSSEVALYLTENAAATVEKQSVDKFFSNAIKVEDWMGDDEKSNAKRFEKLVETINAELEKPSVYRIGEREITAAIIGKVAGGFGGVVTVVIET